MRKPCAPSRCCDSSSSIWHSSGRVQPQADLINGQKLLLLLLEQGEDAVLLSGMVLHISYPPKRIKLKLIFILIYIIRFTKRFVKGEKYSIFVKNV